MKCTFRKVIRNETIQKNGASGKYGEVSTTSEEYQDCYGKDCSAYVVIEEGIVGGKVKYCYCSKIKGNV